MRFDDIRKKFLRHIKETRTSKEFGFFVFVLLNICSIAPIGLTKVLERRSVKAMDVGSNPIGTAKNCLVAINWIERLVVSESVVGSNPT